MAQLFANAARSTLTASITSSSTQLQINPADQALFPVATGADWFKVALEDSSGNLEYMRVQRAVGQSLLTITERATEDATKFPARAFVAGSLVELRMTAADLASSIAHPTVGTGAHAATAISVTPAGGISAATVQAALQELDSEKANASDVTTALTGKASTGANTFTGAQTLPDNAVDNLHAVPKQQAESIAADAVADRVRFYQPAAQATTSGTEKTFPSIPSWAKRITVMFYGVSGTTAASVKVRALVGGVEVTTGYVGTYFFFGSGSSAGTVTDAFCQYDLTNGATNLHGHTVLTLMGSNTWTCNGSVARHGGVAEFQEHSGSAVLSGAITDIRVLCTGGAFDGGLVAILVEG